jgi:hypothetical protein
MHAFDYGLALISVLVSLALAELATSLHKLLRHGRTVKWDVRALIATALVALEIVRLWFGQWSLHDVAYSETFSISLAKLLQVLVLYLLAAAALPDKVAAGCDLRAFYDDNRRHMWGLFAVYQLSYVLLWLFVFHGGQADVGGRTTPLDWVRVFAPLGVYAALAVLRNRALDYAGPVLIIGLYLWLYWNQVLAG